MLFKIINGVGAMHLNTSVILLSINGGSPNGLFNTNNFRTLRKILFIFVQITTFRFETYRENKFMMNRENENMLSDILNEPSVPHTFSDSKMEQILTNISSSNIRLKQYVQDWLKCKTDDERHILTYVSWYND
jgi:hypothetical protein